MKTPKILLIHKRSSLSVAGKLSQRLRLDQRFQENHKAHYATLHNVEAVLTKFQVKYHKRTRSPHLDYAPYDVIITVGGDGTLLEAARGLNNRQMLLGVNSDPQWSVGQFCSTDANTFEKAIRKLLDGKSGVCRLFKLKLNLIDGKNAHKIECLNDVLICHANPAAMSRYELQINKVKECQRSSGVWFSTASGSTGAMASAGGGRMPIFSTDIQYKPRELYYAQGIKYDLTGGFIRRPYQASVISLMAHGRIFVDGSHVKFPFTYGSCAEISSSKNFIRLIHD